MANLFFGCFGNGVTVCNKGRIEHGDYKKVAHIDECGAVKFYDDKLPSDDRERINACAKGMAARFKVMFLSLDKYKALDMLDNILFPASQFSVFGLMVKKDIAEIYETYIEYACRNMGREMPEM